jgi:hypothetical protein
LKLFQMAWVRTMYFPQQLKQDFSSSNDITLAFILFIPLLNIIKCRL